MREPHTPLPEARHRDGAGPIGWSATALRARVTVTGLSGHEADLLDRAWSRCSPVSHANDSTGAPASPGTALDRERAADWTTFHEELVFAMTRAGIESGRGELLMFHAAALAEPATGAAIALVASSGTGKTTATRVLGRHLGYVTDETVAVDPAGGLVPFPKPLSVLPSTGRRPKSQLAPDDIALLPAPPSPCLARVAVLDRERTRGVERATAHPLPLEEALEWLSPQISSLSALTRGLVRLCRVLDGCGGALRLNYSEAEQLVPLARGLLAAAAEPLQPLWRPLELTDNNDAPDLPGLFRRAAADDAVGIRRAPPADPHAAAGHDESVAVLHGERLTVLAGLGPVLWAATERWASREQLMRAVTDEFGEHPDAGALLDEKLSALQARGLLERS